MYASHRDACILAYYSSLLSESLEHSYADLGIGDHVIAYRRLGKANYHFGAEALLFAQASAPCMILAFDVSKFFDGLDHSMLKRRLRRVLGASELSNDWYAVFRHVTRYRKVELEALKEHPVFGPRISASSRKPIATVAELKAAGVSMIRNADTFGIPQGTPISSTFANLYMIEFDCAVASFCNALGGFYRRYSDDILIICKPEDAAQIEMFVADAITSEHLKLQTTKTERTLFEPGGSGAAQYLGFTLTASGASIRPSSISRQGRKLRRTARRIEKAGLAAIADGRADKIYTRTLRRRFSPAAGGVRNFSSYARRSADALGSKTILRQARRLERELEAIIKGFK